MEWICESTEGENAFETPQALSITHALCYWQQSNFFYIYAKRKKAYGVLCGSAACLYRRYGNSWFDFE